MPRLRRNITISERTDAVLRRAEGSASAYIERAVEQRSERLSAAQHYLCLETNIERAEMLDLIDAVVAADLPKLLANPERLPDYLRHLIRHHRPAHAAEERWSDLYNRLAEGYYEAYAEHGRLAYALAVVLDEYHHGNQRDLSYL